MTEFQGDPEASERSQETPVQVLLVDDHAAIREGIKLYLDQQPFLKVVGTAKDATEGLRLTKEHKPNVVLMDVNMPGVSCFQAVQEIRKCCESTKVVVLSALTNDRYIAEAISNGVIGYVTKDEPLEVIAEAIRKASLGIAHFSDSVRERLIVDEDGVGVQVPKLSTRASLLTDRELEILSYIAKGLTKREIAQLIFRSMSTVDKHTENLMAKLKIHNRVELTRFAIREGLAEP